MTKHSPVVRPHGRTTGRPTVRHRARVLLSVIGLGAAASLALSGCASGSGSSGGGNAKKLTMWISTSAEQEKGFDQLATEYKKDSGVSVSIVNIPNSGMQTKLRNAAQANALPDIARATSVDPIWINKTEDLSSIATDPANKIQQSLIVKGSDGKVNSIPSDSTAAGLFVNKTLFDKAGVSFPTDPSKTWTWQQFIEAATQVKKATGAKYDLVFDASPGRLRAMTYEFGGDYMQLGSNGTFSTNDKTKTALEFFKSLNDDSIMPKSVWTSGADPNALFKSGQVVAYFSGIWQVADFSANITDFDWASAASPASPIHATDLNVGGDMVAFDNGGGRGDAAKEFLAWLYQPAHYSELVGSNEFLPVESGLTIDYPFTDQASKDSFALYNKEIELAAPISSYFTTAQMKWVLKGKTLTTDPTLTEVGKYINGQQNVDATIKNIIAGYDQQAGGK
ncbi:MAG TPA: extracellular solute-binding protein [Gryllotalpicola sp.]